MSARFVSCAVPAILACASRTDGESFRATCCPVGVWFQVLAKIHYQPVAVDGEAGVVFSLCARLDPEGRQL